MSDPVPRLSVILPIYNGGQYLDEALQSLANQSWSDFEVLAIDDSSTDDSVEVVQRWVEKDKRFHLLHHPAPHGLPQNINFGIEHARGQLIARFDQDDISHPERFATQIAYLEKHPEIQLVGTGYQPFGVHGTRDPIYHPSNPIYLAWRYISNSCFAHPSVMFRRDVLSTIPAYPVQEAEDFGFFSLVVQQFPTTNIPRALLSYREHTTNMSVLRRDIILKSVHATFIRNYQYYFGTLEGAEVFYHFHAGRVLPARHFFTVYRQSLQVVRIIRKKYRWSWYNRYYLQALVHIKRDLVAACLRSILHLPSLTSDLHL